MSLTHAAGQGMTFSDQIARHAHARPDDIAVSFDGVDRSYRSLDERGELLARALDARGVRAGDRLAVLMHNNLEMFEAYVAAARIGAICVPINFRLLADEVAFLLDDSGASTLIVDDRLREAALVAGARCLALRHVLLVGEGPTDAPDGSTFTVERYEEALRSVDRTEDIAWTIVPDEAAAYILYTSGTTGRPKGAVLTHRNMTLQTTAKIAHMGLSSDCRTWLVATPIFHIGGLASAFTCLYLGGRVVLMPSSGFDADHVLEVLERERINFCFLVPVQWQAVCDAAGRVPRDLSALRVISWSAAPASTELVQTMIDLFPNAQVCSAFGQTESGGTATMLRGVDTLRKVGSVGTAMLNVEIRIVDEEMRDVPQGEVGEIVYRSPMMMKEYWNLPRETAEAFRGGWFHSGDLMRQDADGFLFVVDRAKDMIISGGENIYSVEVENVVLAHPKVSATAVIGVKDERWGETPLALVVPLDADDPPGVAELADWCRGRLAGYKRPREVVLVPDLPRNSSGKILKAALRERAEDFLAEGREPHHV